LNLITKISALKTSVLLMLSRLILMERFNYPELFTMI
jgi:hypothetical protein